VRVGVASQLLRVGNYNAGVNLGCVGNLLEVSELGLGESVRVGVAIVKLGGGKGEIYHHLFVVVGATVLGLVNQGEEAEGRGEKDALEEEIVVPLSPFL